MRKPWLWLIILWVPALACNLTESSTPQDNKLVTEERPSIVLLAPASGSVYAEGTVVTLHAEALDLKEGVSRIEFVIDLPGEPLTLVQFAETPSERFQAIQTWQSFGNQTYIVEARAYRDPGTPQDPSDDVPSNVEQVLIEIRRTANVNSPPQINTPTPDDSGLPDAVGNGTINAADTVVRQGPATTYPVVTTLNVGDSVEIVGRSEDNLWFVIDINGGAAWVFQQFVSAEIAVEQLSVIGAPPPSP